MASRPVALTFDDGPDPIWTPRLLDALQRAGVIATFFVVGERVARHAPVVRDTLARGHRVEPHCGARHTRHTELTRDEIEEDIDEALAALHEVGVPRPTMWRPPYGVIKRPDTIEVATARELTLMGWTHDPRDYLPESSTEVMLETFQPLRGPNRLRALARELWHGRTPTTLNAGASILLHDGRIDTLRTTSENTVEMIEPLVGLVREQGGNFELFCAERHPTAVLR